MPTGIDSVQNEKKCYSVLWAGICSISVFILINADLGEYTLILCILRIVTQIGIY